MRGPQVRGLDAATAFDPQVIAQNAHALRTQARAANEIGASMAAGWQGLSAVYRAPEAADLERAMAPIEVATRNLSSSVSSVSAALETYAQDLAGLQARQRSLATDVNALMREAVIAEAWQTDSRLVGRQASLQRASDQLAAGVGEAQARCIAAIEAARNAMSAASAPQISGSPTTDPTTPVLGPTTSSTPGPYVDNDPFDWSDPFGLRSGRNGPAPGDIWEFPRSDALGLLNVNHPIDRRSTSRRASDVAYEQLNTWMGSNAGEVLESVGQEYSGQLNSFLENGMDAKGGDVLAILGGMLDARDPVVADAAFLLMENFQTGGIWDAKVQLRAEFGIASEKQALLDMGNGYDLYYDVFGNMQYGFMMSHFGVNEDVAIRASNGGGVTGNADDYDNPSISLGYDLAELYPDGFSSDQFYEFITSPSSVAILTDAKRITKKVVE